MPKSRVQPLSSDGRPDRDDREQPALTCSFTIPASPLSTNQAYKLTNRGKFARMYLSKEATQFKQLCGMMAMLARPKNWLLDARYRLELIFCFKDNRPDADGPLKLVLDALQGCLYNNDRQIDEVHYHRQVDPAAPRVEVFISVRNP